MRFWLVILLFFSFLHGANVSDKLSFQEILSNSAFYIDTNNSATIENIVKKEFTPIKSEALGFGYSPAFNVWIRCKLSNSSKKEVTKIIEYGNPLTSYIDFFDAKSKKLLKRSGMLNKDSNESINPTLKVTLKPLESKTFYIKISSKVTALVAKLYAWSVKEYNRQLSKKKIVLALFFGAMLIIVIYNSIIFLIVRKRLYLYYVLAFSGILLYYLLYQGVAPLLFSKGVIEVLNYLIPFIVLLPVIFLSLFTQEVLNLKNDRKLNKIFNIMLLITVIATSIFYILNLHATRNLTFVVLFFMLFGITLLSLKRSSYAKYLLFSWLIFFATALLMYLENTLIFNLSSIFPYYSEVALILEAVAFSLIIAHSIEKLELDKLKALKEIKYKELLINELDHRISGSLQSMLLRIEQEEERQKVDLDSLKKNIFAIGEIHRELSSTKSFPDVNMQEYFSNLLEKLQKIYGRPNINIKLDVEPNIVLKPKSANSCAKILNEAITNIYKYAFSNKKGDATVTLKREKGGYIFIISDNGQGIKEKRDGSLGLLLMQAIVKTELNGDILIDSLNGVKITIRWGL